MGYFFQVFQCFYKYLEKVKICLNNFKKIFHTALILRLFNSFFQSWNLPTCSASCLWKQGEECSAFLHDELDGTCELGQPVDCLSLQTPTEKKILAYNTNTHVVARRKCAAVPCSLVHSERSCLVIGLSGLIPQAFGKPFTLPVVTALEPD